MKRWGSKEIEFLKSNYKYMSPEEIGLALNRSIYSVKMKKAKLKLYKEDIIKVGEKFNKLTIIGFNYKTIKSRTYKLVECECDCGNIVSIHRTSLIQMSTVSCGCSKRKNPGDATWNYLYRQYRYDAKSRNYIFDLNKIQFIEICSKNCNYCNAEPKLVNHYVDSNGNKYRKDIDPDWIDKSWIKANGVDRKNNDKGYTLDNCAPCCTLCNVMKMDKTKQEFLEIVNKIYFFNVGEKNGE